MFCLIFGIYMTLHSVGAVSTSGAAFSGLRVRAHDGLHGRRAGGCLIVEPCSGHSEAMVTLAGVLKVD